MWPECALFDEDLRGRRAHTLANSEFAAGFQSVPWDQRDASGSLMKPGVYLCRLQAGSFRAQKKMVLLPQRSAFIEAAQRSGRAATPSPVARIVPQSRRAPRPAARHPPAAFATCDRPARPRPDFAGSRRPRRNQRSWFTTYGRPQLQDLVT